ncbi:hypothetical protein KSZ_63500 [Dictyobacter formicarum]|uniref:Transposase InsH N-terminal domain-containing protein n=1 Tax=Dictyobacter formicarum TaxID=2778368 RepID=A0ABQ3VRM0_9CHLR|nr:hypothetical protein KSZ_63500 [Dictyobacter formicarum]
MVGDTPNPGRRASPALLHLPALYLLYLLKIMRAARREEELGAQLDHAPSMLAKPPVKGLAAPCIPAFLAQISKTSICKALTPPHSFLWVVAARAQMRTCCNNP